MRNTNKFKIRVALVLLIGLSFFSNSLLAREFRIQYVAENDESFLYELNKVKEKQIYILPDGSKLYFTSDVYNCRDVAEKELKRMLASGFTEAKIRIFFGNKISANNYVAIEGKCQ